MSLICPKHNTALTHKQGISKKTGKPYDFWGCPTKDGNQFCDYTENPKQEVREEPKQNTVADRIDKVNQELQLIANKNFS